MTANAKDTVLAVAGQAGGVARAIEGEVEVGVGLITRWYAVPHLCEGSLQQTRNSIISPLDHKYATVLSSTSQVAVQCLLA